jgi:hypothetical protein
MIQSMSSNYCLRLQPQNPAQVYEVFHWQFFFETETIHRVKIPVRKIEGIGFIIISECGRDRPQIGWPEICSKLRTNNIIEL